MTLIQLKNVNKSYLHNHKALKNINLNIDEGEFVYLVGPSGAGKSTLIKSLYREVKADSGKVLIDRQNLTLVKSKDIPYIRRKIGVVFQDYKLISSKTIFENVAYAMESIGARRSQIKKRVNEVLTLVGLLHKSHSFPHQLSGGEQQRIAIARAIVNRPKLLIADEPTGNLDRDSSWNIMNLLERINLRGTTVIMATHDSQIVNTLRHRVIALENGEIVRDEMRGDYGYDD